MGPGRLMLQTIHPRCPVRSSQWQEAPTQHFNKSSWAYCTQALMKWVRVAEIFAGSSALRGHLSHSPGNQDQTSHSHGHSAASIRTRVKMRLCYDMNTRSDPPPLRYGLGIAQLARKSPPHPLSRRARQGSLPALFGAQF
jgi:hypothetical protein